MAAGAMGGAILVLIMIPVLAGLWIGVVALGRAGKGGAWWSMMVALVAITLGAVLGVLGTLGFFMAVPSSTSGQEVPALARVLPVLGPIGAGLTGLGYLLFAWGFAAHGMRARRVAERIGELESVIEAQNETMRRESSAPGA